MINYTEKTMISMLLALAKLQQKYTTMQYHLTAQTLLPASNRLNLQILAHYKEQDDKTVQSVSHPHNPQTSQSIIISHKRCHTCWLAILTNKFTVYYQL